MDGLRPQEAEQYCFDHSDHVGLGREPAGRRALSGAAEIAVELSHAIEAQIIPRLMLAHRTPAARSDSGHAPGPDEALEMAALVIAHEAAVALAYIEALRARGTSLETVYLELLAPAARHLGKLWEEDACSFTEVTLGLCRLQHVLNELSAEFRRDAHSPGHRRRALLVPAPGEQHSFGLSMVAEFFRRAGWDVWGEPSASREDLAALVRAEWFAVIGFSLSCEARVLALAAAVRATRRASRNRRIGVMVGGRAFADHPELAAVVGADAMAVDAQQACMQAETLFALCTGPAQC